jgi:hypothetical protein
MGDFDVGFAEAKTVGAAGGGVDDIPVIFSKAANIFFVAASSISSYGTSSG